MKISTAVLGATFILAGMNHFRSPQPYLQIMPPVLPYPLALVYLSGAAEIAGGLGVLFPVTRRVAMGLDSVAYRGFSRQCLRRAKRHGSFRHCRAAPDFMGALAVASVVCLVGLEGVFSTAKSGAEMKFHFGAALLPKSTG